MNPVSPIYKGIAKLTITWFVSAMIAGSALSGKCSTPPTASDTLKLNAPETKCFPAPITGMPSDPHAVLRTFQSEEGRDSCVLAPLPPLQHRLPVIHIAADPQALFGWYGILQQQRSGQQVHAHFTVQFDQHQPQGATFAAMLEVHAPSQDLQRSLRLEAQKEEGQPNFARRSLPGMPDAKMHSFILRNGGADAINLGGSGFRDLLAHTLYADINPHYHFSAGSLCHVYLNGRYYGASSLRQRFDKLYFRRSGAVAVMERDADVAGSFDHHETDSSLWVQLSELAFEVLSGTSPVDPLLSQLDRMEFYDYHILEIFSGNRDWLTNNVYYFCDTSGVWHPVLWDLDWGFGLFDERQEVSSVDWNSLTFALSDAAGWEGSPPSNEIFRALMTDSIERSIFSARITGLLHSTLSPPHTVRRCDSISALLMNELHPHFDQWGGSPEAWQLSVARMRRFLIDRPAACIRHVSSVFGDSSLITLSVGHPEGGTTFLGGVSVSDVLTLPGGILMEVQAIASEGHRFIVWSDGKEAPERTIGYDNESMLIPLFAPSEASPSQTEIIYLHELPRKQLKRISVEATWNDKGVYREASTKRVEAAFAEGAIAVLAVKEGKTLLVLR